MTRDEMTWVIIRDWGRIADQDDICFLNNSDGWGDYGCDQRMKEDEKRWEWLSTASVDLLPLVEDLIINPPDFAALKESNSKEISEVWPYTNLEEDTWYFQISGMFEWWQETEPDLVAPLIKLLEARNHHCLPTSPSSPYAKWRLEQANPS